MLIVLTDEQQEQLNAAVDMAARDHGGAVVLRSLILGAYNGDEWRVDLTDLRRLDDRTTKWAWLIISIAAQSRAEIHTLVDERRSKLIRRWASERADARKALGDELGLPREDVMRVVRS